MSAYRGKDKPVWGGAPIQKKARTVDEVMAGRQARECNKMRRAYAERGEYNAEDHTLATPETFTKRDWASGPAPAPKAKAAVVVEESAEYLEFWRKEAEKDAARKEKAMTGEQKAARAKAEAERIKREAVEVEAEEAAARLKSFADKAIWTGTWKWGDMAESYDRGLEALNQLRESAGLPAVIVKDEALERVRAMMSPPAPVAPVAVAVAVAEPVAEPVAKTYFKPMDVAKAHADHTLRIGDLPFDIQWGDLKALFDGVGVPFAKNGCVIARDRATPILSIDPKIKLRVPARATPWDDYTKSPKGGAFVKFDSHAQAERALLKLQGTITMRCSYMGVTKRPHIDWAATDSK
jgi:hypothetical protein